VDDDEAVRSAMGYLLTLCGFEVKPHESGAAFLERLPSLPPGVILLDLRMPLMSGLEVQLELERRQVTFPIIYLTAHGDLPTGVQAMKRGAIDFLEKPVKDEALLAALELAFPLLATHSEGRAASRVARVRAATLTRREREVMDLVVRGRRNREIARDLDISLQTVKVHRMRGMTKMGVSTIPDLTRAWAAAASADSSGD
jgi:FixJ family two-component response regulator